MPGHARLHEGGYGETMNDTTWLWRYNISACVSTLVAFYLATNNAGWMYQAPVWLFHAWNFWNVGKYARVSMFTGGVPLEEAP